MSLSIVQKQVKHIIAIQEPSGQQPIYSPVEWECCQGDVPTVLARAQTLNSTLDEVVCHYQLVLELTQQFEKEASVCHDLLSRSRSDIDELRSSVLEGCLSNQPWTSAAKVVHVQYTLQPNLQPSPFQSQLASFKAGQPIS